MRNKGFTLVELLVVVAIIAILATISVTVFSAAQGSARDGKRRSEINSISKSIESAKAYDTGIYSYDNTAAGNDFPKGFPDDPVGTTKRRYCIASNLTTTPPAAATDNTVIADTAPAPANAGCPATGATWAYVKADAGTVTALPAGTKSWVICATLERGSLPFCQTSLTK